MGIISECADDGESDALHQYQRKQIPQREAFAQFFVDNGGNQQHGNQLRVGSGIAEGLRKNRADFFFLRDSEVQKIEFSEQGNENQEYGKASEEKDQIGKAPQSLNAEESSVSAGKHQKGDDDKGGSVGENLIEQKGVKFRDALGTDSAEKEEECQRKNNGELSEQTIGTVENRHPAVTLQ